MYTTALKLIQNQSDYVVEAFVTLKISCLAVGGRKKYKFEVFRFVNVTLILCYHMLLLASTSR